MFSIFYKTNVWLNCDLIIWSKSPSSKQFFQVEEKKVIVESQIRQIRRIRSWVLHNKP